MIFVNQIKAVSLTPQSNLVEDQVRVMDSDFSHVC